MNWQHRRIRQRYELKPSRCTAAVCSGRTRRAAIACLVCLVAWPSYVRSADEPAGDYEAHEISLWITQPGIPLMNPRQICPSALPGAIGATKKKKPQEAAQRLLSPLAILTFHGKPQNLLDVDLRITQGRFTGCWPAADLRSARVRWLDAKLIEVPANGEGLESLGAEHWLQDVRKLAGLRIKRNRAEACLAYETEINSDLPVLVEEAAGELKIANLTSHELLDVTVVAREGENIRVAHLDRLPTSKGLAEMQAAASAAKGAGQAQATATAIGNLVARLANAPVAVPAQPQPATPAANDPPPLPTLPGDAVTLSLSPPLAPGSAERTEQTRGELRKQLIAVGLTEQEADFFVDRYEQTLFEPTRVNVIARLDRAAFDQSVPLALDPEPRKLVRAPLLLIREIDPRLRESVDRLVAQLGAAKYSEREEAEKSLLELGQMTVPTLRKAIDHVDAEISMRSERIIAELTGGNAAPPQAGGGVF